MSEQCKFTQNKGGIRPDRGVVVGSRKRAVQPYAGTVSMEATAANRKRNKAARAARKRNRG
jgi:hypothetical protein